MKLYRRGQIVKGCLIDVDDLLDIIKESIMKEITIVFKKKSGDKRTMRCMYGVKPEKPSKKGMAYKPEEKGMVAVWDLDKKGYRMITLKEVTEITYSGDHHMVAGL